ncbi:MAG: hypothetical protein ACE5HN_06640 [Nitrospiria bacterium]
MIFGRKRRSGIVIGIYFLIGLFLYSCGLDLTEETNTTAQPAPADTQSASAATKSVAKSFGAFGTSQTGSGTLMKAGTAGSGDSPSENDAQMIRKGLDALKGRLQSSGNRQKMLMAPTPVPCISGTGSIDDTADSHTETYANCLLAGPGPNQQTLKNGSVLATLPGIGEILLGSNPTIIFTNFEESVFDTTLSSVNPISYEKTNGTMTLSGGEISSCGTEVIFTGVNMTMPNATFDRKEDLNADGTLDWHELFTATDLRITVTESMDTACVGTGVTIVLNGGASFDDVLNPTGNDNYSATFTNFTLTLTEVAGGESVTMNGQIAITSTCVNGTVTVSTVAPLFFPTGMNCPTAGEILVTGEGSTTTAVTYTSTGGIDIDEGNDGTVEKQYLSCEGADVCITNTGP